HLRVEIHPLLWWHGPTPPEHALAGLHDGLVVIASVWLRLVGPDTDFGDGLPVRSRGPDAVQAAWRAGWVTALRRDSPRADGPGDGGGREGVTVLVECGASESGLLTGLEDDMLGPDGQTRQARGL